MNKCIYWVLILLMNSIFATSNAFAQDKKNIQTQPIHPLAENLAKIGAFSCAQRANQIGSFLTGNIIPDIVLQTPKDNPNNRLLMSTMVIPDQNKQSIVGIVSLAPNQVNGCGGSYHTVSFSNKDCSKTTVEKYPKIKFQPINQSKVQISVVNQALWLLAIPADKGCILLKEEIIE